MTHARLALVALAFAVLAVGAHAATPAVSAGDGHALALRADGSVRAWGDDSYGALGSGRQIVTNRPSLVIGVSEVAAVAAGGTHTLALRSDGSVWGWGSNVFGQLGDGTREGRSTPAPVQGLSGVVAIAAGEIHSVALKADGTVWAWGANGVQGALGDGTTTHRPSPVQVVGLGGVVAVDAGNLHTVALKADGTVWAWGNNASGQVGDGTTENRLTPVLVPGLPRVTAISVGTFRTFALRADGMVSAWGLNTGGQLGDGTTTNRLLPVLVSGLSSVTAISAGGGHTLALRSDRTVAAWGVNFSGQLGDGTRTSRSTPILIAMPPNVVAVSAGGEHSAALRSDGLVLTWGYNGHGQLGDGSPALERLTPGTVGGLSGVASIASGQFHTIALKTDGSVQAWGRNNDGQLGDGVSVLRSTPGAISGLGNVVAVGAGTSYSMALGANGTVFTWGRGGFGVLGDGSGFANRSTPGPVPGLAGVTAISAGGFHALALRPGAVLAWGYNDYGQVGDGTTIDRTTPVQVVGLADATAISAGYLHSVALRADGTVASWGRNQFGQLGDGTTLDRVAPVVVPGLSTVVAISAGTDHTLALRADGTVWAWGSNGRGALGDGSTNNRVTPTRVVGLPAISAIAAGALHSVAVGTDGTLWAWGWNNYGQLGDGTTTDRAVPIRVVGATGVRSVSANVFYTLAVRQDGSVLAWGFNERGQLGDGTYARRTKAAAVRREDGAGRLETNDWFLDLDPAVVTTIASEQVPPFLVTTTGAATNVAANVLFRTQDVGSTGSVFVFAVAPADVVRPAANGEPGLEVGKALRKDGKADDVACVLAQLNASGQLQAVSASSLQAFVTGVLGSQGQAVTVINGASTVNIGGATFYVGYGTSASAMISGGLNRSVASIPGAKECKPQAPQTGWWWYPPEDGRGYSIEVAGRNIFYAAFLYDAAGSSKWYVATGQTSLDGSLFTGDLLEVLGGQTLFGAYRAPSTLRSVGPITLAFNSATAGTMVWPGGTVPLERFNIVPNGLTAPPQENLPEAGWWWNPDESGRGFFIEFQNGSVDIAGYMYDDAGNAVWYLTVLQTPNPRQWAGSWWTFGGGQTLTGAYRRNTQTSNNFAPLAITFDSATTATLTLPGGRTTRLIRHRF